MSLDIYLTEGQATEEACPHCGGTGNIQGFEGYEWSKNITHNLRDMAIDAGIYGVLWRPEEQDITKASEMIEPLRVGLALLKSDPARFEKFNAQNGWGLYKHFVPFVEAILRECEEHPDADVRVSR